MAAHGKKYAAARKLVPNRLHTVEDARRYIADGPVASYAQHGFGLYLVCLTDGGTAIGMCGLLKRDSLDDVDLGCAFLPAHWGNGYARESASAVLRLAWEEFALARVVAIVSPGNVASIALLGALGFIFERSHQNGEVMLYGCERA